jgi:hypothetical protein
MVKSNRQNEINSDRSSELINKTINKKKKTIDRQISIASTTTNEKSEYAKAQEWIHENVIDWVELERIKLEAVSGRTLTKAEMDDIKKMQFNVVKIVDIDQYGQTVKWNNYSYKYNTVYNHRLKGKKTSLLLIFYIIFKFSKLRE